MKQGVIYKITSPTGKIYVGSTIDFINRVKHYRAHDCKAQRKLFYSLTKHGFENHKIEIIEHCTIVDLLERERYFGELYNTLSKTGLNLSLPGFGEVKALISPETIDKMRLSQTGAANGFFGRKHTEESKLKSSLAKKGKAPYNKGIVGIVKASEETKDKMRLAQLGRTHNPVTKDKMRVNNQNLKIVVCLQTGIFFNGTAEAGDAFGINRHTLKNKLNGNKPNNTSLIYAF